MAGLPTSPPLVLANTALLRYSNLKESPHCLGSKKHQDTALTALQNLPLLPKYNAKK